MAVRVAVAPISAEAVRLANAGGAAKTRIVDWSEGGLGLSSDLYLPLTCALRLTFTPPGATGPVTLDTRVQRVAMSDRKPTYYVGTSFDSGNPEQQETVARLLTALRATGAAPIKEPGRA